jgi:hypothetical protein
LEQTLQPDEQMWVDVGKLIREHVPDKNGTTLPDNLTTGSYEFRDLTDIGVGSLFEGKVIYDKTYGHVAYGCSLCCVYDPPILTFDPLGIPLLGDSQNGVAAYNSCSNIYSDVSNRFYNNWSTINTAVATVNATALHHGVAVGSTTSHTHGYLTHTNARTCPAAQFFPTGGDNVQKPSFVRLVSALPDRRVCLGLGCEMDIKYRVLDQNGTPINIPGMTVSEAVTVTSNTCNTIVQDAGTWSTDPTGTMTEPDIIRYCCTQGQNCGTTTSQTFKVNGNPVLIMSSDGLTTGTHNVITDGCTNGNGSCAVVKITP